MRKIAGNRPDAKCPKAQAANALAYAAVFFKGKAESLQCSPEKKQKWDLVFQMSQEYLQSKELSDLVKATKQCVEDIGHVRKNSGHKILAKDTHIG